jgi:hypothetical protein
LESTDHDIRSSVATSDDRFGESIVASSYISLRDTRVPTIASYDSISDITLPCIVPIVRYAACIEWSIVLFPGIIEFTTEVFCSIDLDSSLPSSTRYTDTTESSLEDRIPVHIY